MSTISPSNPTTPGDAAKAPAESVPTQRPNTGGKAKQRRPWAKGTLQVMLKGNPLVQKGLSLPQRLMYFSTMWSYLSGFAAVVFLAAPFVYLVFGVLPVKAYGLTFLAFFTPYILVNQLLFLAVGYGKKTWRGHPFSLALFPPGIKACLSAFAWCSIARFSCNHASPASVL